MIWQELLAEELQTPINILAYCALALGFEVVANVLIGKKLLNEDCKWVKEEQDRFLEELNMCKMEKKKLETTLLEK